MDLQRFTTIVIRSLPGILLLTFVAAGAAFAVSIVLPKQWESEARLLVGSLTETDTQQLDGYQQLASTYSEVATSTPVMLRVIDRLDLPDDPVALAKRVDVKAAPGQAVIKVTARAGDPQAAADLANAFASEIVKLGLPAPRSAAGLVTRYQPGTLPLDPSWPKPLINALIAAGVGFVVGVGLAALLAAVRGSRAAAAERRRDANALVPTLAPALGPAVGQGTPGRLAGVGPRYPSVSVTAVAPMPRPAQNTYEAPQIAEASRAAPPRPASVSAWGPLPVREDPSVSVWPPVSSSAAPPIEPSGPSIQQIDARTAPPPRSNLAPSATIPSSIALPSLSPSTRVAAPPRDDLHELHANSAAPAVTEPTNPQPTIPLVPAGSRPSVPVPSPTATPQATTATAITTASVVLEASDGTGTIPSSAVKRTRKVKPVTVAQEVDAAQQVATTSSPRRSAPPRHAPASAAPVADTPPSGAFDGDDASQAKVAPAPPTDKKKSARSTAGAPPVPPDAATETKPRTKKSARSETEGRVTPPPPPSRAPQPVAPAASGTRKAMAPASQS